MATDEATETEKSIQVFVDDKKVTFASDDATGAQIMAAAGVPANYSLYRRAPGSNEPIAPSETVELKPGEHFFSRPPANIS